MAGNGPTTQENKTQGQNTTQSQTQNQQQQATQQSQTAPWEPTQGLLTGLLGNLGGISPGLNPWQASGINTLVGDASSIPNYGGVAKSIADQFIGSNTNASQGLLTGVMGGLSQGLTDLKGAYGDYTKGVQPAIGALSTYLNPNYLDPMSNPAMKGYLDMLTGDITSGINGQFASAGRFNSPANTQALSRGLAQGLSGPLLQQYNSNVNAQQNAANSTGGLLGNLFGGANNVFGANLGQFGAGNTTAMGLNTLEQQRLQNLLAGLGVAGQIPGLSTAPGSTLLAAGNTAYGTPLANIAGLLGLTTPVAGLGASSSGSSSGSGSGSGSGTGSMTGFGTGTGSTYYPFGAQQGLSAGIGLLGGLGSLGQGYAGLSSLVNAV